MFKKLYPFVLLKSKWDIMRTNSKIRITQKGDDKNNWKNYSNQLKVKHLCSVLIHLVLTVSCAVSVLHCFITKNKYATFQMSTSVLQC